ncbi:hypothetical protein F8M41_016344 [Gigaspora margarita]|uniref:Ion transport domain-containing protein n=1 Tax=Gigaspora margarita TaxID=4874 RepID=A0A8H4APF4_GIGMA|nr:hypothetical protein F8M41_016344 [Gigaspora margarita]
MSSSKSEESLSGDQDQTKILIDDVLHGDKNDVPHGGQEINLYFLSPNMQYIATVSREDKSLIVWTITKDLIIKYDNSLNGNDLVRALNADKFCKNPDFKIETLIHPFYMGGISDCKQVIITRLNPEFFEFDFAIFDITTKSRQILSAQGLEVGKSHMFFLENGDLAIVKSDPVYRAYIFSKSNSNRKHKWICKNIVELEKFNSCHITEKGKLFLYFKIPGLVMQWDLITRKFDMRYILNFGITSPRIELSFDNALLAICGSKKDDSINVSIYLTKSGLMVATRNFDKYLSNFCFIGLGEEERLFLSFETYGEKKSRDSYILNPRTHSLDKSPDTHVLYDIYNVAFNDKSIGPINIRDYDIISDYIIKNNKNKNFLSIQRLSKNDIWKSYLERKEDYYGNTYTYFNVKEIMQFLKEILDKYNDKVYESDQFLTQSYSNEPEVYRREQYAWIIEYEKKDSGLWNITLKAQIESDEAKIVRGFYFLGGIFEKKVLENGDMLLVLLNSIRIYTINSVKNSKEKPKGELIYCWCNRSELEFRSETCAEGFKYQQKIAESPKQSIISLFTSFKNNLNLNPEILPSPIFRLIYYLSENSCSHFGLNYQNPILLKLYGKEIYHKVIEKIISGIDSETILFNYCNEYSSSMLESDVFNSFMSITCLNAFELVMLEKLNKNQRFTEEFLSKINMLINPHDCYIKNDSSLLYNLQHFGTNVSLLDLFNTSLFNRLFFWISKKFKLFKESYPQVYQILAFHYSLYSYYVPTYPQDTAILIFPLLNFATYPKNYSYSELIYLQGNPFTSLLDSPDYFKWWNIKALINFKWNVYGKLYYFIIWAIYSIFMCYSFGTYFAIMIGVAQKVFSFLIVLGIMVIAFAHSLHLLLRPTSEYSYDQPSFTDDANNPWNLVPTYQFISSNNTVGGSMLIETPDDNTNWFTMLSTSILAVYFILTGDSSSVSSWDLKNNWTLAFLLVIFSFFTTIYLMNLFISLLGNAIDERNNEESFLQLKGEILSEIELFWMLPHQRRKDKWFPDILYYKASVKELEKYVESIEDKKTLHPKILEITKTENSEEKLKNQINEVFDNESFKNRICEVFKNESFKNQMTEVFENELFKNRINEVFENESFKNQITEVLKNQMDETLTNKIKELKNQVNEILKDPLNKINKLIEIIEKKESE